MSSSASPMPRALANRTVLFCALAILLVLGIRLSLNRQVTFCGVPDSCSYLSVAETLSTRHIFQAQFADDLQLEHVALPTTGIEYWRPGTSFFLLLAKPFGGVTLHSSLFITILAGLLTALVAWRIVMHFNQDRGLAALSVLLCFLLPAVWDSSTIADSGLYYAAAVAWFLALFTVRFQGYLADALALICVCIAYLVRNDAVILIVPLLVVLLLRHRAARSSATPVPGSSLAYCAVAVAGFFLALAPMHLIDLVVLGKTFPSAASRVLFFTDLSDLGRYGQLVDLHSMLSMGVGHLIKLRLVTFPTIVYRIAFILIGAGLLFVPLLFLRKRPDGSRVDLPEMAGGLTFLATLLAVYGFILPAVGTFSALRTSMGLLPLAAVLMLVAIRNFLPARPAGVLATTLIAYYLIFGVMYGKRIVGDRAKDGDQVRSYGAFLRAQGADPGTARVITDNPDQMYVTNGYPAIQLPTNGADAIGHLATDLHATHVLIDTSAHDLSLTDLRNNLHPVAIAAMPNSTFILLTLPMSRPN